MNNYELMVIFTPVLSEEEYKAAQKKFAALVTENGGEVVHTNPMGTKITGLSHCQKDHWSLLGNGV